jgi:DNA polymerase III delta prime subunit
MAKFYFQKGDEVAYRLAYHLEYMEDNYVEEMEERNKRYAIEAFAEYKKQQRYHDIGNTVYDYLDVKGLIQFSKERKIQIAQQAKQDYLKANSIAQATSKEDRTEKQKNIYEVTSQTKKGKDVLRMESKRLALKEYFDFLITTDQELKDLI